VSPAASAKGFTAKDAGGNTDSTHQPKQPDTESASGLLLPLGASGVAVEDAGRSNKSSTDTQAASATNLSHATENRAAFD
jgi:hypothetical protein